MERQANFDHQAFNVRSTLDKLSTALYANMLGNLAVAIALFYWAGGC